MTLPPPPAEATLERLVNDLDDAAETFWTGEDYDAGDHEKLKSARAALREYLSEDTRRLDWLIESGGDYFWRGTSREAIDTARRASMKERPE